MAVCSRRSGIAIVRRRGTNEQILGDSLGLSGSSGQGGRGQWEGRMNVAPSCAPRRRACRPGTMSAHVGGRLIEDSRWEEKGRLCSHAAQCTSLSGPRSAGI